MCVCMTLYACLCLYVYVGAFVLVCLCSDLCCYVHVVTFLLLLFVCLHRSMKSMYAYVCICTSVYVCFNVYGYVYVCV